MNSVVGRNHNLRAYLVGAYLFSVPAFGYSASLGLLIIPQAAGVALVAYALLDILKSLRVTIPREIGLYGVLGAWIIATLFFVANPSEESISSLQTLIKVVLATLACAQLIKQESDFIIALKMFVLSMLFAYIQNIDDLRYLRISGNITEADRFAGTLNNANTAAVFSVTVIWAALFLFLISRKRIFPRVLLIAPTAISLLIIYYSGSKKGLLGSALLVLFITRLLYMRYRSSFSKKIAVVLIACFLIIVIGYYIYTSPFFIRVELLVSGRSEADINRYQLAREALSVWTMNWRTFLMGVGHDNFRTFSYFHDYSHSTPFELLASNGAVGFLLFLGFMVLLFDKFIYLYRKTMSIDMKSIYFTILIYIFIYSIFLVGSVLYVSRELLPLLGCLAAYGQIHLDSLKQGQKG